MTLNTQLNSLHFRLPTKGTKTSTSELTKDLRSGYYPCKEKPCGPLPLTRESCQANFPFCLVINVDQLFLLFPFFLLTGTMGTEETLSSIDMCTKMC